MNLLEIKEECWDIARDYALVDEDRLWPSNEMDRYVNRAYKTIARETKCIVDAITPSVCLINSSVVDYTTYTAGTLDYMWANNVDEYLYHKNVCPYLYDLHPSIIEIEEVKWVYRPWKLLKVSSSKWQQNPKWEQIIGTPTEFATDLVNKKIALNYRSEEEDTLQLKVRRMPLTDLANDDDIPEIREQYHILMLNGILAQMYRKQDADIINEAKSVNYDQKFKEDIDVIKQEESILYRKLSPNNSLSAFR